LLGRDQLGKTLLGRGRALLGGLSGGRGLLRERGIGLRAAVGLGRRRLIMGNQEDHESIQTTRMIRKPCFDKTKWKDWAAFVTRRERAPCEITPICISI
jgi:hypothetical protein